MWEQGLSVTLGLRSKLRYYFCWKSGCSCSRKRGLGFWSCDFWTHSSHLMPFAPSPELRAQYPPSKCTASRETPIRRTFCDEMILVEIMSLNSSVILLSLHWKPIHFKTIYLRGYENPEGLRRWLTLMTQAWESGNSFPLRRLQSKKEKGKDKSRIVWVLQRKPNDKY